MFNLLTDAASVPSWILPVVLLVILVAMYAYNVYRQKKYQATADKIASELKVGDKIKTYGGLYGIIVEIQTKGAGKMAIVKTGSDNLSGYFSVDIAAIYPVDKTSELEVVVTDELLPEAKEEPKVEEAKTVEVKKVTKTSKPKAKKE